MVVPMKVTNAVLQNDIATIQEWFSTGTRNPDDVDRDGWALLTVAAYKGQVEPMRVLLAHGANADVVTRDSFSPPLHVAVAALHSKKHLDMAVLLLDHGADANAADPMGTTPLMKARRDKMYRLLLRRGANFDARDTAGRNAETIARERHEYKKAALLAGVRLAGGWRPYVRYPRFKNLMLRYLAEQGRARSKKGALLERLFPSPLDRERPRGAKRTERRARIPKEVFWHIFGYWRSDRD